MRIILLAIVSLYSLVSVLQAQVAAPSLNPAGSVGTNTFNPAVLNWGGPSRVGAATVDFDAEFTDATGTTPLASGDGIVFQARFVGDNLAFHVDILSISLDVDPGIGGGTLEFDDTFYGASYQWDESFSIGLGIASTEENGQGPIFGGSFVEEASLPLLGATLRLGESLLVGAATGTETIGDGTGIGDVDRSVLMIGAALHSRDKMGGYHLEAYMDNRADAATGVGADKEETFGLTAEVVFMENFLLGVNSISTDITDSAGVFVEDVSETIFTAGWVNGEGMSYVVSSGTEEETDPAGDITKTSVLALAVAYAF